MSQDSDQDIRNSVVVAFWEGLTRPSPLALFTLIGVVCGTFLLIGLLLTPASFASGAWRFVMTDDLDVQTYVTHKVLGRSPSQTPRVILLGSSVTVRCVESEARLSELIAAKGGGQSAVHDLATDAQMTWEMAALLDRLPPGRGGVLVIGLTPGILANGTSDEQKFSLISTLKWPKLGFTSGALDDEARRAGIPVPWRSGIYLFDNANFFLSRRKDILRNIIRGGVDYADPLTASWYSKVNRPEFWLEEIAALTELAAGYEVNADYNFAVIARFVEQARKAGPVSVIVLESPVNPRWQDDDYGAQFYDRYRADLKAFAAENRFTFLAVSEAAGLKAEDFVDYEGHIGNAPARLRCTKAVADSVAHELKRDS